MKNALKTITVFIASALILFSAVGESHAILDSLFKRNKKSNKESAVNDGERFTASGKFTGSLGGTIEVSGLEFVISEKTSIYVHGEGSREAGSFVVDSNVYVGGVMKKGVAVANFVVVRRNSRSLGVSLKRATSLDAKFVVKSPSNPSVGSYDYSHGYQE